MSDYIELRKALDIIFKRWWLLLLLTLVATIAGYAISQRQTPVYAASTTIMVGQFIQATELSRDDLLANEILSQTYADMARRQPVLQGVIDSLELPDTWSKLRKRIRTNLVEGTQLIQVTAEADSTELAQAIADEVALHLIRLSPTAAQKRATNEPDEFVKQRLAILQMKIELGQTRLQTLEEALAESESVEQTEELQTAIYTLEGLTAQWESSYMQMLMYMGQDATSNSLTIVEPAQANPVPIRPRIFLNVVLAGAAGFFFGLVFIFWLEFSDDTLRSPEDVNRLLNLPALGTINTIHGKHARDKLLLFQESTSPVTEAYRIIRSNIEFKTVDHPIKSIVVTSPGPGEGKSITVANLAIIMAWAGYRTILVDADLRQPVQHHLFQIANSRGLEETIRSPQLDPQNLLIDTRVQNLQVLTSVKVPQNPAELLGTLGMRQLLKRLGQMADVVIYDSPPTLGLTDASILANRADGVVLVIEVGQTRVQAVRQAIENLQQANANVIGVILNRGRLQAYPYYNLMKRRSNKNRMSTVKAEHYLFTTYE